MRYPRHDFDRQSREIKAAIFVDYENLFTVIQDRIDQRSYPDEYIAEMIDELRRYLLEEDRAHPALAVALADFGALSGNGIFIQRSLYLQGVEPRFVPSSLQSHAVELQFCADVIEALHTRPDIRTFALLTGNRAYLPVIQQLKQYGRTALVACLESASDSESIQYAEGDYHLDAHRLLSEASRRELLAAAPEGVRRPSSVINGSDVPAREPVEYKEVTDPIQLRTLDIIETFFGQYEEVYLTPLLRKLSELLDDREHDPKTIISTLEEMGAVRLEKRRGFPYDYTVLIIDGEHPDVKRVQEEVLARDVDDDGYDDDYYDEYDDEEEDYSEDYFDEEEDAADEEPLSEENMDEEPR